MSDSDWETNTHDNVPARVPKQNKWDDEDAEEEDVKENWEESSDEEKEEQAKTATTTTTTTTPAAPSKKKISAAQRAIAKKEKMNNNDDEEDDDDLERKKKERQAMMDADLENTKGMFGIAIKGTEVNKSNSENLNNAGKDVATKGSLLDTINPKTKVEFNKFSRLLIERIQKHENNDLYVNFINDFVRDLCLPLKDAEVRKVSITLATLANDKTKQAKEKDKPKKKVNSKPVLQVENYDDASYEDYYDEYDDFM